MSIPRINSFVRLVFVKPLCSNQGLCGVFPFSFCRQPIVRKHNACFQRNSATLLCRELLQSSFFSQFHIYYSCSPLAVVIGLNPAYTYYRIVTEPWVTQIMVNIGIVKGQVSLPNSCVWQGRLVEFIRRI